MGREAPVFINRPYPKVVYLSADRTVWKTAHSEKEEREILSANIPAPKVEGIPDKVKNTPPSVDVNIEVNQKRRPGRPPVKG